MDDGSPFNKHPSKAMGEEAGSEEERLKAFFARRSTLDSEKEFAANELKEIGFAEF